MENLHHQTPRYPTRETRFDFEMRFLWYSWNYYEKRLHRVQVDQLENWPRNFFVHKVTHTRAHTHIWIIYIQAIVNLDILR